MDSSLLAAGLLIFLFTILPGSIAFSCGNNCEPPKSSECTILVNEILRIDRMDEVSFECILDPVDSRSGVEIIVPLHTSNEQKETLKDMLDAGDIMSGLSTLNLDQDMLISHDEGIFIPISKKTFHIGKGAGPNQRRLMTTEGDKPLLVVNVIDSEGRKLQESSDEISDDVFGTYGDQMTLKSQMSACSFGKVNIIAGNGNEHELSPGVIEVVISKSLVGNSREVIRQAAITEAQLKLGHNLPGPYTHVMFVLEGCYTGALVFSSKYLKTHTTS